MCFTTYDKRSLMQNPTLGTPSTHSHALHRQLFKVTINKNK